MQCPECGDKTLVYRSRKTLGTVIRLRRCEECGFRFVTEELEVQDEETLKLYKRKVMERGEEF